MIECSAAHIDLVLKRIMVLSLLVFHFFDDGLAKQFKTFQSDKGT